MRRYLIIILSIALQQVVLVAQPVEEAKRHEKIFEARKAFISEGLELTEDQEKRFLMVYGEYMKERYAIMKQSRKRRYKRADLDEVEAKEILQNVMQQKRQEMELQLSFYDDLSEFLEAKQILHLDYKERRFREKVVEKLRKGRKKRHE